MDSAKENCGAQRASSGTAALAGWGTALGAVRVPIAEVEREFGMAAGKLAHGAGLEALCRAGEGEDEVSLARAAAEQALRQANVAAQELDWILATSETVAGVPALGAGLHSALRARGDCGVLDVGGACAGVANALFLADALFAAGKADTLLIASGDVHSRLLRPGKVAGEFAGLFGDGASAFVLRRVADNEIGGLYRMRLGLSGCAGAFASAIVVRPEPDGGLALRFEGDALARAAVDRMVALLGDLEAAGGRTRAEASAVVIHQPNPRVVGIFQRQAGLAPEQVPLVTRASGNLGSSTCGMALAEALARHSGNPRAQRGPIFIAALGPGLLWAGALLE
ncbi:MAG TPA: 3-oxoacyl-[acyl-carrier-protein] synthase III C-terminal domain-containing protein [Terriglobales bacterium]|nr:3-oxoacyl-[acyl-carrier-protein] synthase III C-terminal domain-containing protein [Terriglobales bacterium]